MNEEEDIKETINLEIEKINHLINLEARRALGKIKTSPFLMEMAEKAKQANLDFKLFLNGNDIEVQFYKVFKSKINYDIIKKNHGGDNIYFYIDFANGNFLRNNKTFRKIICMSKKKKINLEKRNNIKQ